MQAIKILRQLIEPGSVTYTKKAISAIFFTFISMVLIVIHNHIISRHYDHPPHAVFEICGHILTMASLWTGRRLKLIQFPSLDMKVFKYMFPLLVINIGKILMSAGLHDSDQQTGPLFKLSCRFVLLITMTMLFELIFLGVRLSGFSIISIAVMATGAMLVGTDDISIRVSDFAIILINNIFCALHRVFSEKILESRELGMYGALYYSSLYILVLSSFFILDLWSELAATECWKNLFFWYHLVMMSIVCMSIMYSQNTCLLYNGALTTVVISSIITSIRTCLDVLNSVSEVSTASFVGLNIIAVATLAYMYDTFKPKESEDLCYSSNAPEVV